MAGKPKDAKPRPKYALEVLEPQEALTLEAWRRREAAQERAVHVVRVDGSRWSAWSA
jgi:hypothetical protein